MAPKFRTTVLVIDGLVIVCLTLIGLLTLDKGIGILVFNGVVAVPLALNFFVIWRYTGDDPEEASLKRQVRKLELRKKLADSKPDEPSPAPPPQADPPPSEEPQPVNTAPTEDRESLDPRTRRQTTIEDIERLKRGG